ncbi:hypothetical protein OG453_40660 [Streptomyces sp. NBC_01381]|nr:hypothetical protein [Streptomyces sp. NBC_01381]MCX4672884.1 hypothetical protein [Streptomyces sp. NBC_01381]
MTVLVVSGTGAKSGKTGTTTMPAATREGLQVRDTHRPRRIRGSKGGLT